MIRYNHFVDLADTTYPHCTLTEQLTVYVQHYPNAVVPFLEELIRELHPEPAKIDERHPKAD